MNLAPLGYFSKTQGLKGQLVLKAEADFFMDELKVLFVEIAGAKAPYFVGSIRENGNSLVVQLEEVDVVEKAKTLVGKKVFIDAGLIDDSEADFNWLGFELVDARHGVLGLITEVSDNGQQVLLNVNHKGKDVMLPLVEEFIDRVDEVQKKLFYKAPEGLIELYLGE